MGGYFRILGVFRALQHRVEAGPEWDRKGSGDGALGWGRKSKKIMKKCKFSIFQQSREIASETLET